MIDPRREIFFEKDVCEVLASQDWLYSPTDEGYDRELALFPEDIFAWLKDTQPEEWAKVEKTHNAGAEKMLLQRLTRVLDSEGTLAVLRNGFKDVSAKFEMCQFKPAQGLNPEIFAKYGKVRLRVMRQAHYSLWNENTIDLVLFVNGLPVATAELKTDFTQSVEEAIQQYKHDRRPRDPKTNREEPLLAFKRRAVVHFAVSSDEVWTTTKLEGQDTVFLPFNVGCEGGKGNPVNPSGYRTGYLWERIWNRDTWLDIVGRFAHIERIPTPEEKTQFREEMVFPRFHQWEAVTGLVETAKDEGPGHRYLIQHSAGSGKTHSIKWLAHQLASLHDEREKKVFDSVIVVTDRTVLDTQLQEAIFQFEHKHGVVTRILEERGSKSSQLAEALRNRVPVIIVTIQTFPFVKDAIESDAGFSRLCFAVIADEAHSSQTGATANKLKSVLTQSVLTQERQKEIEDGGEVSLEEIILADAANRAQPKNISYFAFTATPKAKTMELFGRPGPDGLPEPFHLYSMQQAIEEGFILDVLQNYTPYRLAFKLAHNGREYDDEQVDKSEALKSLMRWVRLHPYNIAQKVEIIVEHFRANVGWRLDRHAKAMVVTGSRKEAVRYKLAMDKYIANKGYTDVRALIAFSGEVHDPESGREPFNEWGMNPGLKGRDHRKAFETDDYNVMIVANKFQTGFDQPRLVAMYVDKRLADVAAVQTLSRLNRTYPGKNETFVLDFVNDPEEILGEFRKYYKKAELAGVSDPNLVHDLQTKLDAAGIYTAEEVESYVKVWLEHSTSGGSSKQGPLHAKLDPAVSRFQVSLRDASAKGDKKAMDRLKTFRQDLGSYVRAYDFLSQIVNYEDTDLEKRRIFYDGLLRLLPIDVNRPVVDLSGVDLTHYKLKDQGRRKLALETENGAARLHPLTSAGSGQPRDPKQAYLSQIIEQMNNLFEGELTDADLLNYAHHIRDKMLESEILEKQAAANRKDQFGASPDFQDEMMNAVISAQEGHKTMSEQVLMKDSVKQGLAALLLDMVYQGFAKKRASG